MLDAIIAGCGALGKTTESCKSAEIENQTFPSEALLVLRASQREPGYPLYIHVVNARLRDGSGTAAVMVPANSHTPSGERNPLQNVVERSHQ